MERYYQPEIECASREQIKAWQDERLVKQVRHVWDNVPYYRKKMEEKGLTPDDIRSSDDLHKLPCITKADLREAYPYGLVAKPLKECVRIPRNRGFTGGMQRGHHGMGNGNTDLGGAHFLFYSPDTFGLRISVSDDPVPAAFSGDSPAWIGGADDHFVDVDTSRDRKSVV